MIKESIYSIEKKLEQRKQFLMDDNLEKLQEEFLKKKEKCNSKIIKINPPKESKNENNINSNSIFIEGEIKKKKGKKVKRYNNFEFASIKP